MSNNFSSYTSNAIEVQTLKHEFVVVENKKRFSGGLKRYSTWRKMILMVAWLFPTVNIEAKQDIFC